jgi:hypothetical protein
MALHEHGFKGPRFIEKSFIPIKPFYFKLNRRNFSSFNPKLPFILPNTRSNKRIGPHNKEIYEFLFGSLLGDCTGEKSLNGGVRFRFKQSIIHKDYLFFIYKFFLIRGYTNNNLPSLQKDLYGSSYRFNTYNYTN